MKQTMIGTWKMAFDGIRRGAAVLREQSVKEAIRTAIQDVEQREEFVSVGKGGLPNIDGHVQLDAAYMDGKTLNFGGVIEMENVVSAIEVAASCAGSIAIVCLPERERKAMHRRKASLLQIILPRLRSSVGNRLRRMRI